MKPEKVLDHLDVARHLLALPVHGVLDLDPAVLVGLVPRPGRLALADLGLLVRVRRRVVGARGQALLVRDPDVLADEHVAAVLLLVQEVLAAAHVHDQEQCCSRRPTPSSAGGSPSPTGAAFVLFAFITHRRGTRPPERPATPASPCPSASAGTGRTPGTGRWGS